MNVQAHYIAYFKNVQFYRLYEEDLQWRTGLPGILYAAYSIGNTLIHIRNRMRLKTQRR